MKKYILIILILLVNTIHSASIHDLPKYRNVKEIPIENFTEVNSISSFFIVRKQAKDTIFVNCTLTYIKKKAEIKRPNISIFMMTRKDGKYINKRNYYKPSLSKNNFEARNEVLFIDSLINRIDINKMIQTKKITFDQRYNAYIVFLTYLIIPPPNK